MINNLKIDDDIATFTFKDDDYSVLNAIRRVIVGGYIRCVAIDNVSILKNNTTDLNETELSHKFEAIRIKQKVPEGTLFTLDKTNNTDNNILVYYGDIIATYENKKINDVIIYPNAYFVALGPGQSIKITGEAKSGCVHDGGHSGYLSTGSFGYTIEKKCSLQFHEQFTYGQIMKAATNILKDFLDQVLSLVKNDDPIEIPNTIDIGVVYAIRAELIRTYPDLFVILNKPDDKYVLSLGVKKQYDYIKNACITIKGKL